MNNVTQFIRKHVLAILVVAVALAVPFGVASAKYTTTKAVATDIQVTVEKGYYLDKGKMWTAFKALSDSGVTTISFVQGSEVPASAVLQDTRVQADGSKELGCYWDSASTTIYIAPADRTVTSSTVYAPEDCSEMFYGIKSTTGLTDSLTAINFGNFNTSKVTSMKDMFGSLTGLTSLDLSGFDTSKVTDMFQMFATCVNLATLNVSSFDTRQVTDFGKMFWSDTKLTTVDLSSFVTSSATNMLYMFYNCTALTSVDVSNFDTSKVTDMTAMYYGCKALVTLDISSFSTESLASGNAKQMFYRCSSLTTIYASELFNNKNITSDSNVFYNCTSLVGGKGTAFSSGNRTGEYARIDGGPSSATPGYFTDIADKPTS